MKVLNVNMSLDPVYGGGSVERTFQMSRHLAGAGVECTVVTTDIDLTLDRVKAMEGVEVVALPTVLKRYYLPRISYRKIESIVKKIDIIHLMNHWTFLNVLVYIIARREGKPYVICPAGSLPYFGRSKNLKKLYNMIIGRRIVRNAARCIAISGDEIDQFHEYGVNTDNVSVIPNGIDPDDFHHKDENTFRDKLGIRNEPLILFMGRLSPIKGPDLLLGAFCNMMKFSEYNYHLVFAGPDGGMLAELKKIALKQRVDERVHFAGYVSGDEKLSAYQAADLLVIPSRREAMSIVVLEAGMTKTPVLLTDKCGFNVVDDINGGKVVPATVEGLQTGLINLLSEPDQLVQMGKNLHRHVSENFTWQKMIKNYLLLYETILRNNIGNNLQ